MYKVEITIIWSARSQGSNSTVTMDKSFEISKIPTLDGNFDINDNGLNIKLYGLDKVMGFSGFDFGSRLKFDIGTNIFNISTWRPLGFTISHYNYNYYFTVDVEYIKEEIEKFRSRGWNIQFDTSDLDFYQDLENWNKVAEGYNKKEKEIEEKEKEKKRESWFTKLKDWFNKPDSNG